MLIADYPFLLLFALVSMRINVSESFSLFPFIGLHYKGERFQTEELRTKLAAAMSEHLGCWSPASGVGLGNDLDKNC